MGSKLSNALGVLLRVCECGALVAVAYTLFKISVLSLQAEATFARLEIIAETLPALATTEIDKHVGGLRAESNAQLSLTRMSLDRQLSTLNATLAKELDETRKGVLDQTGNVTGALAATVRDIDSKTLPSVNAALDNANTIERNANVILINPDIPKAIRDVRLTAAFAGQAMVHVETTSDAIAKAAPATTAAIAGISTDIHTFTASVTKPQPWYKRVLSVLTSGAALSAKFF